MKKIKYLLLLIPLLFISKVNALTFDTFDVTWYYRNKSDETTLLNVVKSQDKPLYASSSEYVNGFTTRIESTFTKDVQYIVNYRLQMYYYVGQDGYFRDDTIDRLIKYSYVDSDFKLLNTEVKQIEYECQSSNLCIRTFNISEQVLTLNNTNAIRFGVYTTENISLGFYNHTQEIDYIMLNNISITDNANATIIDQNNQIINGQNNLQNSITNTEDSINQNIDDMEQSIVDSNKETQDVIKDQFNDCHDSYNQFNGPDSSTVNGITFVKNDDGTYNITGTSTSNAHIYIFMNLSDTKFKNNTNYTLSSNIVLPTGLEILVEGYNDTTWVRHLIGPLYSKLKSSTESFDLTDITRVRFGIRVNSGRTVNIENLEIMLNEGSSALTFEPYGEEICSNKIDDTNDKLDGIQGALTDSSAPNTSGLENSAGWLPAGPLDSVLNLPLSLFNALTTNLNKTCNPINIPLPYVNKNITLPCINTLYNQIGITSFLSWIGVIVSGLMLYTYLLKLYKWIEDRISLNETHNVDSWGGL